MGTAHVDDDQVLLPPIDDNLDGHGRQAPTPLDEMPEVQLDAIPTMLDEVMQDHEAHAVTAEAPESGGALANHPKRSAKLDPGAGRRKRVRIDVDRVTFDIDDEGAMQVPRSAYQAWQADTASIRSRRGVCAFAGASTRRARMFSWRNMKNASNVDKLLSLPSSHANPASLVPEVRAALAPTLGARKRAPASPKTPFDEPFENPPMEMAFAGLDAAMPMEMNVATEEDPHGFVNLPFPGMGTPVAQNGTGGGHETRNATPDEVERLRHALDLQSLPLDDLLDERTPLGTVGAAPPPSDGTADARGAPRISIDGMDSLQKPPSSLPSSLKDGAGDASTGVKSKHRSKRSLDAMAQPGGSGSFQLRETFTQSLTLSQQQRGDAEKDINQNTLAVLRYLEEKLAEKQLGSEGAAAEGVESEWSEGKLSLKGVADGLKRNHVARLFHQILVLAQASRILATQEDEGDRSLPGDISVRLSMLQAR